MKRVGSVIAAGAIALAATASALAAGTTEGKIKLTTVNDPTAIGSAERAAGCAATLGNQGTTGWVLATSPGEIYTVKPSESVAGAAFAISFYSSAPTCDSPGVLLARHTGGPNGFGSFANPTGTVPFGATVGVITLLAGPGTGSIPPGVSGKPDTGFIYRES